MIKHD